MDMALLAIKYLIRVRWTGGIGFPENCSTRINYYPRSQDEAEVRLHEGEIARETPDVQHLDERVNSIDAKDSKLLIYVRKLHQLEDWFYIDER